MNISAPGSEITSGRDAVDDESFEHQTEPLLAPRLTRHCRTDRIEDDDRIEYKSD